MTTVMNRIGGAIVVAALAWGGYQYVINQPAHEASPAGGDGDERPPGARPGPLQPVREIVLQGEWSHPVTMDVDWSFGSRDTTGDQRVQRDTEWRRTGGAKRGAQVYITLIPPVGDGGTRALAAVAKSCTILHIEGGKATVLDTKPRPAQGPSTGHTPLTCSATVP